MENQSVFKFKYKFFRNNIMKIIHVIDFYIPYIGFAGNSTIYLAKKGYQVKVFTSDYSPLFGKMGCGKERLMENLEIIRFSSIKFRKFKNFSIYPQAIKKMLTEKPEIIHAYGLGCFSTPLAGYLKIFKKFPLVLRADFNILQKIDLKRKFFYFFWRQIPLLKADVITVHITKMKEILEKNFLVNKEKIEILPHGIDFKRFNKAKNIREKLGVENKFVILNVSRADSAKDPIKIIQALPLLKKVTKDFVFIHIGKYYDKNYYQKIKRTIKMLKLESHVKLLGPKPNKELPKYYKSADVYVQSSNEESFCLATLEAAAAGLPIIATKTGAIGYEWFKKYEYWFSTSEELGKKLVELYENKNERKKLGKIFEKIAKNYDWKIIIKKLEKIYEKALEKCK